MKKLLFTVLLTTSCLFSFAQKFHIGLKIQPNIGYAASDTNLFEGTGSKIGFDFGLIADYMFGENYGFGSGLTVSNQGFKMKQAGTNDTVITRTYKMQYIEVPLSIKLKTNKIGQLKYWGQFGVVADVAINAKADIVKTAKSGTEVPAGTNRDVSTSTSLFRAGLLVAGGVEYEIGGNASLVGGVQYTNGFTDIYTPTNAKFTNSYIGLTIGVLF